MLCEKCKKNYATVHYQQNINGELTEYHLCNDCANEMNLSPSFDDMFTGFLNGYASNFGFNQNNSLTSELSCPTCGFTFNDISNLGKIGCADCYKTFGSQLNSILKNVQASNVHCGKIPKKAGSELRSQRELENLKYQLKTAVENENYEEAAKLRDKIKDLERGE